MTRRHRPGQTVEPVWTLDSHPTQNGVHRAAVGREHLGPEVGGSNPGRDRRNIKQRSEESRSLGGFLAQKQGERQGDDLGARKRDDRRNTPYSEGNDEAIVDPAEHFFVIREADKFHFPTMFQSVKLRNNDATKGKKVNARKPMIQGLMKR